MAYKMTDELCKLLTEEVLGYVWWSLTSTVVNVDSSAQVNRTFTNDADMMAVFYKIVEKELWVAFDYYAFKKFCVSNTEYPCYDAPYYIKWLFLDNPERACVIAAMFWVERDLLFP